MQGALVRLLVGSTMPASHALEALRDLTADSRHEFWPDSIGFDQVSLTGVIGHRQVTDSYLAGLVRYHGGSLATFDTGLAALLPDVALLVP